MTTENETTPTPGRSKTPFYLIGGIVLLVLLSGAAFLAGRLMNNGPAGGFFGFGPDNGPRMMQVRLIPAPELPATEAEARGVFASRDGNSLFLHPQDGIKVIMNGNGEGGLVDESTGPAIEVVVTRDTKVYRDATNPDIKNGSQEIQQVVEAGNLEEIDSRSFLAVWGRKTDNRIVADVIVYTNPVMSAKPVRP